MKGDFTRNTFRSFKDYSGVRMQQGRVQLDSDWNEQAEINLRRQEALITDLIGSGGVPLRDSLIDDDFGDEDFQLSLGSTFYGNRLIIFHAVSPLSDRYVGRVYVEGKLVEQEYPTIDVKIDNSTSAVWSIHTSSLILPDGRKLGIGSVVVIDRDDLPALPARRAGLLFGKVTGVLGNDLTVTMNIDSGLMTLSATRARLFSLYTYDSQPYYTPNPATLPTSGKHLAYLDVWTHHVTSVQDPALREAALGGPDTATRTQTIWQLKLLPITDLATVDNGMWVNAIAPALPPSTLKAKYNLAGDQTQALENRLYRVEIHAGGIPSSGGVKFKWSRDNGSQTAAWTSGDSNTYLYVATQGRDEALSFAADQWLEATTDSDDLTNQPGAFVRISETEATPGGQRLKVTALTAITHPTSGNPKVRRWDSNGGPTYPPTAPTTAAWIPLENGIEIQFDPGGKYQIGDYWLIPARPSESGVEWQRDGVQPLAQTARRTEHGYLALGLLDCDTAAPTTTLKDKRRFFNTLPALTAKVKQLSNKIPGAISVLALPTPTYENTVTGTMPWASWKLILNPLTLTPYIYLKGTTDNYAYIPVQLPQGATLLNLHMCYEANIVGYYLNLYLYQLNWQTGVSTEIARIIGYTTTKWTQTFAISGFEVDNKQNTYYIHIKAPYGEVSIFSIIIDYEAQALIT